MNSGGSYPEVWSLEAPFDTPDFDVSDFDACYRAVASRDARFDGRIYTAVLSTGIYCRPVCPARTPLARNVRFYRQAAAAEQAGFRACRRCRPEASPDGPDWNLRSDLVGRGLRLIADGVVDEAGVGGLARRLAVSERHLHRLFVDELGVGPLALARTRRVQLARQLLDQTDLPVSQIAFAAGYASLRQFNASIQDAYRRTPTELRGTRTPARRSDHDAGVVLRLGLRPPFDGAGLLAFLGARAVPGIEEVDGSRYRRTTRAVGGGEERPGGVVEVEHVPGVDHILLRLALEDPRSIAGVVGRARRLFDLDADPAAVAAVLSADPLLAPLVDARPGLRLPGTWDGFELAVRAVLGQQVSVAGARTLVGRVVSAVGRPVAASAGRLTHEFPTPEAMAEADLSGLGITGARVRTLQLLAAAVVDGSVRLDGSADPDDTVDVLTSLPGIGPWTAGYIALRALRDPDALPDGDLGLRHALRRAGLPDDARALRERSERWRPWRGYAVIHLWSSLKEST